MEKRKHWGSLKIGDFLGAWGVLQEGGGFGIKKSQLKEVDSSADCLWD